MRRLLKRVFLSAAILFLRWEISTWAYTIAGTPIPEKKVLEAEQSIREIKLMILRMEYNNI
jgi:hypothetical protein